jgi:hypothetical protein
VILVAQAENPLFSRGVRHWAQLSTYLRQKGYKQDWQHDFIFSAVIR